MDRKDFLKTCGLVCLSGLGAMTTLLQSCVSGQYFATNELAGPYLKVAKTEFETNKKKLPERKSVIVKAEELKFPIYLYKVSDTEYSALWMECTHQGAELSAHGDTLTC